MKKILSQLFVLLMVLAASIGMWGCKTNVSTKSICCIQVSGNYKKTYHVNSEFDPSNIIVKIHYKNDTFEQTKEWTYEDFDSSKPNGNLKVQIKYKDVKTFITVRIESDSVFPYTVPDFLEAIGPNVQTITSDPKTPGITLSEDGLTANISNVILTGNFVYSSKVTDCVSMPATLITADLSGIDMSETVTDGMFCNNKKLENVTLPDNLKTIGQFAFAMCEGLSEIVLSDTITLIDAGAFINCFSLQSIDLPEGLITIGVGAFMKCSFTSITIPSTVTELGSTAFLLCEKLKEVNIKDINHWASFSFGPEYNCPLYYAKHLYLNGVEVSGKIVLDDSVTKVGNYAFAYLDSIDSVILPEHLTSIGSGAFCDAKITSVDIPDSVTYIGADAFGSNLNKVNITDLSKWFSIDFGGSNDYSNYLYLNGSKVSFENEIVLDNSISKIGSYAFCNSNFKKVSIPNSVTSLGKYAFFGCEKLTSVNIPEGVTSLGDSTFNGCLSLTSITIPDGVTSLGDYIFKGCSSLTSITIPDGVTSLGNYTFNDCSSLTSITIPDGVTSLGNYTFNGCSSLTSITIPNGVTSLGESTFSNCKGLMYVTIPKSVTSIGKFAFSSCEAINSVYIEDYNNWLSIKLGNSWSSPGYYAKFVYFNNKVLSGSITLPDSMKEIEPGLFAGCREITSVSIPDTVTSIGAHAFKSCTGLKIINIPSRVTVIEEFTFDDCEALTSINIPSGVTKIGNAAFQWCKGLTSITISNTVTEIEDYAFNYCIKANPLKVPLSVKTIGENAFLSVPKVIYSGTATGYPWGAKSVVSE